MMEINNTVSDVVSEFKNHADDIDKNMLQNSEIIEHNEDNQELKGEEVNKFLEADSRTSSTNTSYQDLPSLNMEKDKSELIQSVDEPDEQIKEKPELKHELDFAEFPSVQKCESLDFAFDVQKDISQSKAFVEPSVNGELNAYEKYKFKEDFYSLCKNSPRYRKPVDVVYDSFDSCRNYLKEPNKNFNSDYHWDAQRYSDFRFGLNSANSFRYDQKLESTPVKRDTTKSAFENDPDLVYYKSNENRKECISPLTKKYLMYKNVQVNESKNFGEDSAWSRPEKKFESDFMNLYSFKIKKNTDDFKENSVLNETIESEHLYSDYAKGPVFPSEVYGSRPGIEAGKEGIYTRKKKDVRIIVPDSIKDESLDDNQLKKMDKKLKKLIKKNFKEDLKSQIVDLELNPEPGCWEIPADKKYRSQKNLNESTSTIAPSNMSNSVPYLPLRDVPVHELVKKLRHEFELEGDLSCVPSDLNDVYQRFRSDYTEDKRSSKSEGKKSSSEKHLKKKLEKFVKNPAQVVIESIEPEQSYNEENVDNSRPEKKLDKNLISKKIIEQQKKNHEKKIRELESLVKLERLQIETLQKILKMDPNDPMYTTMYQTYMEKKNLASENEQDNDEIVNVETKVDKSLNEFSQSQIENQISENESSIEEDAENDEHNQAHQESGIESSESSSERNTGKTSHDRAKISSWFCPIQPVKHSVPVKKPVVMEKKPEIFEVKLESDKNEENLDKKFGLQEAFQIYKYDFLKKSRNRVKEIKIKAARRQVAKELKIDTLEQLNAKLAKCKNNRQRQSDDHDDKEKRVNYFTIDKAMFTKNRHVMSSEEIVEQTKKKYQKLPEVQQKKLKQKLEETKIRNRIKSNIFKKTIQQRVLSSGPNFNLNFKALENKI